VKDASCHSENRSARFSHGFELGTWESELIAHHRPGLRLSRSGITGPRTGQPRIFDSPTVRPRPSLTIISPSRPQIMRPPARPATFRPVHQQSSRQRCSNIFRSGTGTPIIPSRFRRTSRDQSFAGLPLDAQLRASSSVPMLPCPLLYSSGRSSPGAKPGKNLGGAKKN